MSDLAFWERSEELSEAMQQLLVMFPPLCRVIAARVLDVPAKGRVGRVVGYLRGGDDFIRLLVQDEEVLLHRSILAEEDLKPWICAPEWLVPVQYDGNKTPWWVRKTLATGSPGEIESPVLVGEIRGPMALRPRIWVVRMDIGEPLELHPDEIQLVDDSLILAIDDKHVPVAYVMDADVVEA